MSTILTAKSLSHNTYEVQINTSDMLGLCAIVTGLFASAGLKIITGHIGTMRKQVHDVLIVQAATKPDFKGIAQDLEGYVKQMQAGNLDRVRAQVHLNLVEQLRNQDESDPEKLYPIQLRIDQKRSQTETVVDIESQDTPAFLYTLTNALALLGINIVRMDIKTKADLVQDRLWLTNEKNEKLTSEHRLRALQWSVLFIKQMTRFLPKAADPELALREIVLFGKNVFARKDFDQILMNLKKSEALENLGKVLGMSHYLWEEFIRAQHVSIYEIMGDKQVLSKRKSKSSMLSELQRNLKGITDYEALTDALNDYKDREMFRIDVRHLLGKSSYLDEFAEEFSDLAEVVVQKAYEHAKRRASQTGALPRLANGKEPCDAVCALGKFGGRELGYASDLELMFIYEDEGTEDSDLSARLLKHYSEVARIFCAMIRTRAEGVFEIDLRLRPYGKDGPLAASLSSFRQYYSDKGSAWNFERQALVKLRPICGAVPLMREMESLRDRYVYSKKPFDYNDALKLRVRQRQELAPRGFNAKYSKGGLLDLEYLTQTLQIHHGATHKQVRQTNTLAALRSMAQDSLLNDRACKEMTQDYIFLRDLINALRIYRGNAKDLKVPEQPTREYIMLGRRMGYEGSDSKVRKLFAQHLKEHVSRAAKVYQDMMLELSNGHSTRQATQPVAFNVIDTQPSKMQSDLETIRSRGFQDAKAFNTRVKSIARYAPKPYFQKVMNQFWSVWPSVPDPDLALFHFEHFTAECRDRALWKFLAEETGGVHLLRLMGASRYLSEIIMHQPETWKWFKDPNQCRLSCVAQAIKSACRQKYSLTALQALRQRETLRIVMAELFGQAALEDVFATFSDLADGIVGKVFEHYFGKRKFSLLGLGKLGGRELNFSSDIDLVMLTEDKSAFNATRAIQDFTKELRHGTLSEFLYRVDFRLRPHGDSGSLCLSPQDSLKYYESGADQWEYQAFIKARYVAGIKSIAGKFLENLKPHIYRPQWDDKSLRRLREIKRRYETVTAKRGEAETNLKLGPGGIRDIEFTVQMLQLQNGYTHPQVQNTNTVLALEQLQARKLLKLRDYETLKSAYYFLRRVESRIQLFENRQVFSLPKDALTLSFLAKCVNFSKLNSQNITETFTSQLQNHRNRAREIFERVFYEC